MGLRIGTGLLILWSISSQAAPPHSTWVAGEEVDALDRKQKLVELIAGLASAEVRAGRWLNAHALGQTCLELDRYRCSCGRDWALGLAGMPSADAETLKAVRRTAGASLIDYAECAETAADAPEQFARGQQWISRQGPFQGLSATALAEMQPAALLFEANRSFSKPLGYHSRTLLEACVGREPVLCSCVRRLGDLWWANQEPGRAIVWWGRFLTCNSEPADARQIKLEIEAARTRLRDDDGSPIRPPDKGLTVSVRPALARARLESGRAAVKAKRLDDAVVDFQACHLITTDNADCLLELGRVLDTLGRPREALGAWLELEGTLAKTDPRRAELKRRLAAPK